MHSFVQFIVVVSFLLSVAFGQASDILTGFVEDESGGVIAGATVTIDDQAGRSVASTTTGTTGSFTLGGLSPGRYKLHFERAAFGPTRMDVSVGAAAPPALHVVLKVAVVRQAVEVVHAAQEELAYSVDHAVSAT